MIKEARKALATAIGGVSYLPERIQPPIALVGADDPYIVQETFYDQVLNLEITLIVERATSEVATDALDDFIESTLDALPDGVSATKVEKPFVLEANGAHYLATHIYTNQTI